MRGRPIWIVGALLAVSIGLLHAADRDLQSKQKKPVTHTVTIDATSFKPAQLTIAAGDTVEWVNKDMIPHTATDTAPKGFDSGTLAPGKSWKRTFKTKAAIDYVCVFHPTMKGRLVVK